MDQSMHLLYVLAVPVVPDHAMDVDKDDANDRDDECDVVVGITLDGKQQQARRAEKDNIVHKRP